MTKLVANMVGRNEASRYLDEVLTHLRTVVDEIVFTDDCSDDDTMTVAKKYTDHVYQTTEPLFTVHEGKLRTQAWHNLTQHVDAEDWVLAIDCDELLWSERPNINIRKLMGDPRYDVINVKFYHMWNPTHYRVDKAWAPNNSTRLFKFFYGGKYADRRLACGSEPDYVNSLVRRRRYNADSGLAMQHLGYMRDEDKQAKYDRYMTLDGGDFHAIKHIQSIMDPDPTLIGWNKR